MTAPWYGLGPLAAQQVATANVTVVAKPALDKLFSVGFTATLTFGSSSWAVPLANVACVAELRGASVENQYYRVTANLYATSQSYTAGTNGTASAAMIGSLAILNNPEATSYTASVQCFNMYGTGGAWQLIADSGPVPVVQVR